MCQTQRVTMPHGTQDTDPGYIESAIRVAIYIPISVLVLTSQSAWVKVQRRMPTVCQTTDIVWSNFQAIYILYQNSKSIKYSFVQMCMRKHAERCFFISCSTLWYTSSSAVSHVKKTPIAILILVNYIAMCDNCHRKQLQWCIRPYME